MPIGSKKFLIPLSHNGGVQPSGTIYIDENGSYDITEYAVASVNTPVPSGAITIDQNGSYDITEYAMANVEIPLPAGSVSITQNGSYDITQYANANVNVPPTLFRQLVDKSITEVTANDLAGVTRIGNEYMGRTFSYCRSLTKCTLPDSVATLYERSFYFCSALVDIKLGNGITSIKDSCFYGCSSLKELVIPGSVQILETEALGGANNLDKAIFLGAIPSTLTSSSAIYAAKIIYVPYSVIDSYKSATNWVTFASRIFPLVATVADLSNIDTTTYTKACVEGNEEYTEYTYDGSSWNIVV